MILSLRPCTLSKKGQKMFSYAAVGKRIVNLQYREVLTKILDQGEWTPTRQGARTKTYTGAQMRFNLLTDGFPLITERSLKGFWKTGINELGAMINGVRFVKDFEAWGVNWWQPWGSPEKCEKRGLKPGDIGPASYGAMFHDWPDIHGSFDQFAHLVEQIKEFPYDKTHVVSPWYGAWLARDSGRVNRATIAPCHGWVQVTITGKSLHLHMCQRSGDVPVGVPSNMVQYAALQLWLCYILGYQPGEYVHTIVNAHIYEDQLGAVYEMLDREPRRLPSVQLIDDPINFTPPRPHDKGLIHKLHGDLFVLEDYNPHPAISGIPVAV